MTSSPPTTDRASGSGSGAGAPAPDRGDPGRRKPLLALAAALAMPGLGHVYGGELARGVSFLVAITLAVPVAARLALHVPARLLCCVLLAGVVAAVGLYLWSAFDAFRRTQVRWARRGAADQPVSGVAASSLASSPLASSSLATWQRPGVYALYAVVAYAFVLSPMTAAVRDGTIETFVVPSGSMMPNVMPGDRVLADKTVGRPGGARLWRGALAIFVNPNDRSQIFIKRAIGLPGDHVEVDGAEVRVNGKPLAEEAPAEEAPARHAPDGGGPPSGGASPRRGRERGDRGSYGVLVPAPATGQPGDAARLHIDLMVPDGQVFVLGDNRAAAVDSRRFGSIPLADVKGIARQVWFSSGPTDGARWSRVGHLLD